MTLYTKGISTDSCGRPLYPTSIMYSRPPAKNTSTFRQSRRAKNLTILEGSSLFIKILHRMSINTLSYAQDISMKAATVCCFISNEVWTSIVSSAKQSLVPRPFRPYWLGDPVHRAFQPNSPAGYIAFFPKPYVHMAADLWVYTIQKVQRPFQASISEQLSS
jgi:hypothetical protein